ncbi:MAG: histone deacetylase [Phototrophicales bacterium]|nr:MAG: histone deacetylase [Phototrophicales bacterium]
MTTAYITHPDYVHHDIPNHPERPARMKAIWKLLDEEGLSARMKAYTPSPATDEHLLMVHTPDYLAEIAQAQKEGYGIRFTVDTILLPETAITARLSAGGGICAVDALMQGEANNALVITRPPGHHAVANSAMGFCYFNNIAIATRYAQQVYGIERVMIVDYDVHHGNGTQDIFYDDNTVMFVSTHQSPLYPGTGGLNETGEGKGKGYTVNIPIPAGHGDTSYAQIYERIIWKVAEKFMPQLIMISAGFDAHWDDPLASMRLSLAGYHHLDSQLIRMAQQFCMGKIIFMLEGGYNTDTLARGIGNIAHALLGDDTYHDPFGALDARDDINNLIEKVCQVHDL